jgi:hypothetical protein
MNKLCALRYSGMCFSEDVSWTALAVSWTGCLALAWTGQRHWQVVAVLLACVGGMQMWEALLWRSPGCTADNATLSSLGAVNNYLEPLVFWVAASWFLQPRSPGLARIAMGINVAYALTFGVLTMEYLRRPLDRKCTLQGPSGSLVWQWNQFGARNLLYLLFLAATVSTAAAYMPAGVNVGVIVAILGSFTASAVMYRNDQALIGSMWCFLSAFLPWAFVLVAGDAA